MGDLIVCLDAAEKLEYTHVFWGAADCAIGVAIGRLRTGYGSEDLIVVEAQSHILDPLMIG